MDQILSGSNKIFIIDGGTGTEIERKKGGDTKSMTSIWSALCSLTDPEILASVHRDYISAGADVIIANTYATMRHVLAPVGKEDLCEKAIKKAVSIAKTEIGSRNIVLAGSVSTHPPACVKIKVWL